MTVAVQGEVSESRPLRLDRFTLSYTAWTAAIFLLLYYGEELDRVFRLYWFLIPVLGLPALGLVVGLVVALIVNAFRRRWRRAPSILAAPILAGSVFALLIHFRVTPDLVRFELWRSSYLSQVAALPATDDGPRLKVWSWGGTGGAGVTNIEKLLVYDDSDKIALPPSAWSPEWRGRANLAAAGNSFEGVLHPDIFGDRYEDHVAVRRLDGHFYLVTESF
jgi:hypothetical protein